MFDVVDDVTECNWTKMFAYIVHLGIELSRGCADEFLVKWVASQCVGRHYAVVG